MICEYLVTASSPVLCQAFLVGEYEEFALDPPSFRINIPMDEWEKFKPECEFIEMNNHGNFRYKGPDIREREIS